MRRDEVQPGTRLAGKYELLHVAGKGGMATVWQALNHGERGFARPVAIKRVLPSLAHDDGFAEMFVEEARVVAALLHPNVVQVLDFCRDEEGRYFIVMEWVEGVDLGHLIIDHVQRGDVTPWKMIARIAVDVLRALGAAHERRDPTTGEAAPVFHRDVTPSNVMIGVHGVAKLADFGLSRAMDRVTLTMPGVVKGKLAYVAPEMVGGARASAGSDMYSLGVVLWEALAARRLFEGDDLSLFAKVGRAEVPDVADVRSDLPPPLVEVVRRLLARDPAKRFASAGEARLAFREVPQGTAEELGALATAIRSR